MAIILKLRRRGYGHPAHGGPPQDPAGRPYGIKLDRLDELCGEAKMIRASAPAVGDGADDIDHGDRAAPLCIQDYHARDIRGA